MNLEIESTHTKITQSGTKPLAQDIFRFSGSPQAGTNSRDVEHDHQPPPSAPADAAFETGVLR